ncbi:hypothetical protein [Pullulanibacillus camelliae]|uniref:hypothetical protein n=1 Tax=Pullulanibacillus camelliae TaxID=1707096 RepID=UPI0016671913|nr:hypothetical protein [Pullulanibacillus camelliae]
MVNSKARIGHERLILSSKVKRRLRTVESIQEPTPEQIIRILQTEHALYHWWAYNALLGYHPIEQLSKVRAENHRFLSWYKKMKLTAIGQLTPLNTFALL